MNDRERRLVRPLSATPGPGTAPATRTAPACRGTAASPPASPPAYASPAASPHASPPVVAASHRWLAPRLRLLMMAPARRLPERERGFSLLELLVVVAILGILVAAALPRFAEFRAAAYDSRSQQDLRNLAAAEELFRATSPTYAGDSALLTGFAASEGVVIALESASETAFVATASHPAGSRDFRWDSSADPPLSSSVR